MLAHGRQYSLDAAHDSKGIDVENILNIFHRLLLKSPQLGGARIVHEDIDPSLLFDDFRNGGLNRTIVGHVHRDELGLGAHASESRF